MSSIKMQISMMIFKYMQSSEISQFKNSEWTFSWLKHHIDHWEVNRFNSSLMKKMNLAEMQLKPLWIWFKRISAKRKATINHARTLTYQAAQIIRILNQAFKTLLQNQNPHIKNMSSTNTNNNFFFSTRKTKNIRSIISTSKTNWLKSNNTCTTSNMRHITS